MLEVAPTKVQDVCKEMKVIGVTQTPAPTLFGILTCGADINFAFW
jgi:hypothetical protein